MKIRLFIYLIIISLILSGCDNKGKTNNAVSSNNWGSNVVIHDLGISSAGNETLRLNARNVWDITLIDDAIYTAVGDFDSNTGPTSIWKYDFYTSKWEDSGEVKQEAVIRFINLNGENIAIGADPVGRPTYAEAYILKNNEWVTFAEIENALHIFDAEYFDDAVYFGVSYEADDYPVVRFVPGTNEYTNIPLYKNGTDVICALQNTENVEYKRIYDLFNLNGRLYCALAVSYTSGKTTIEFFELKNDRFEFCQAFKASGMQMNKSVKNQILFNADASFRGSCYLSLGNLYKTSDFIEFSKINVPNNACVTDLLIDNSGGNEILYILTVVKNNNEFNITIYKLNEEDLVKVCSVNNSCSALSFEKKDNDFYVSLGGDGISSSDIGRVLKIEIN
ncbi:MAG: hypothetical protein J6B22_02285 [Clostridia bacterium]|nr:hypothetical protein [Clostridia bacterium]